MQTYSAPRCLVYYPWYLDHPTGAHAVFLAYCRALREAGFRLDCYAPQKSAAAIPLNGGFFENVFTPPSPDTPLASFLGVAARVHADLQLPDRGGCDESAMVSAALLASISQYDLVAVHYTRCHTIAGMLQPGMRRILFTHDLDAEVAAQEAAAWGRPAPSYTLSDEIARFKLFDLITVLGPDDLETIKSLAPALNVIEAPLVLDAVEQAPDQSFNDTLIWVSSISNFHRVSFEWFWQHVWPRITRARPGCRLIVAGDICQAARALGAARNQDVQLAGFVNDLGELYRRSDVAVAPYYYGGGVKVKVLEALAHGIPVVTTSFGLLNTRLTPGLELLAADDAAVYAQHVLDLLASPERRRSLRQAGLAYIRRRHDPRAALDTLKENALRLARRAGDASRITVPPEVDRGLATLIPWVIERCASAGLRRVALFGAGSHTRAMLRRWTEAGGPAVRFILTSSPAAINELDGIPVVHAEVFDEASVDAIVLSSREFEGEMAELCANRWPNVPVLPVWRPLSTLHIPRGSSLEKPAITGRHWNEHIPTESQSRVGLR